MFRSLPLLFALMTAGNAFSQERPGSAGQGAHGVPAWYLGLPVLMTATEPPADRPREELPRTTVYVHAPVSPTAGAAPMKTIDHPVKGEIALPPHQNTLSEMLSAGNPKLAIGYFVEIGPEGDENTVRIQPQPEKSWPSRPLASAIRIGAEWVPLNNQLAIEYGLELGLLQLEFFDVGGWTWGEFFEPEARELGDVGLSIDSPATPPAIDWENLVPHRPGDRPD